MDELKPCPFCGGTRLFVGTIAECEMQDKLIISNLFSFCLGYIVCGLIISGRDE